MDEEKDGYLVEKSVLKESRLLDQLYLYFFRGPFQRINQDALPADRIDPLELWQPMATEVEELMIDLATQSRPSFQLDEFEGCVFLLLANWIERYRQGQLSKNKLRWLKKCIGHFSDQLSQLYSHPAKYKVRLRDLKEQIRENKLGVKGSIDHWQEEIRQAFHANALELEHLALQAKDHFRGELGQKERSDQELWFEKRDRLLADSQPPLLIHSQMAAKWGDLDYFDRCFKEGWLDDPDRFDVELAYRCAEENNQTLLLDWLHQHFDIDCCG